jgi:hypothetical protein
MAKMPKPPNNTAKLVWRISPDAPKGAWVAPETVTPSPPKLAEPEVSVGSWVTSSFDLLNGTDVVEHPGAMTPGQFNELFQPQSDEAAPTPKK